jgi:DNA-binding transcriptional ArsR family regulator
MAAEEPPRTPASSEGILAAAILLLLAALYQRLRRSELLEQPLRAEIYGAIMTRGSARAADLAPRLGVHWTAVAYHMRVLERAGLVRRVRIGRSTVCIPAGRASRPGHADASAAARRVVEAVRAHPGLPGSQYARLLGMSRSSVHYHLARLRDSEELVPGPSPSTGRPVFYLPCPKKEEGNPSPAHPMRDP